MYVCVYMHMRTYTNVFICCPIHTHTDACIYALQQNNKSQPLVQFMPASPGNRLQQVLMHAYTLLAHAYTTVHEHAYLLHGLKAAKVFKGEAEAVFTCAIQILCIRTQTRMSRHDVWLQSPKQGCMHVQIRLVRTHLVYYNTFLHVHGVRAQRCAIAFVNATDAAVCVCVCVCVWAWVYKHSACLRAANLKPVFPSHCLSMTNVCVYTASVCVCFCMDKYWPARRTRAHTWLVCAHAATHSAHVCIHIRVRMCVKTRVKVFDADKTPQRHIAIPAGHQHVQQKAHIHTKPMHSIDCTHIHAWMYAKHLHGFAEAPCALQRIIRITGFVTEFTGHITDGIKEPAHAGTQHNTTHTQTHRSTTTPHRTALQATTAQESSRPPRNPAPVVRRSVQSNTFRFPSPRAPSLSRCLYQQTSWSCHLVSVVWGCPLIHMTTERTELPALCPTVLRLIAECCRQESCVRVRVCVWLRGKNRAHEASYWNLYVA
jgi:hypothetical protein